MSCPVCATLGFSTTTSIKSPSHVTPAQAARILGIKRPTLMAKRLVREAIETHWGVKMVPMATVIELLNRRIK